MSQDCFCFIFPPSDVSTLNEPVLQGQVEKLNRQNTEHSHGKAEVDNKWRDDRESERRRQEPAELILDEPDTSVSEEREKTTREGEEEEKDIFEDSDSEEEAENGKVEDDGKEKHNKEKEESSTSETSQSVTADICKTSLLPLERYFFLFIFIHTCHTTVNLAEGGKNTELDQFKCVLFFWWYFLHFYSAEEVGDVATCSKRRVTEEDLVKDDLKKSRVEESKVETTEKQVVEGDKKPVSTSAETKTEAEEEGPEGNSPVMEFVIGETLVKRMNA